jgi:hypothetical protein
MFFLLFTAITAVVVLLCTRSIGWSIFTGLIGGVLGWFAMPTLAWGFTGILYLFLVLPAIASIGINTFNSDQGGKAYFRTNFSVLAASFVIVWVIPFFSSSEMMNADQYKELIGEVKESKFNEDVAPIDVTKVRIVNQDIARKLVEKRLGQYPSVGSRVDVGAMNIQNINGTFKVRDMDGNVTTLSFDNALMWAGPLNHNGFMRWMQNDTTQGYVLASATNINETYLVTALCDDTGENCKDLSLRYLLSGSYFGDDINRHLYRNGYASTGLTSLSFEIEDGTGHPYIVATKYERTIGAFGGDDAVGVVVVDIQTGDIVEYSIDDAPAWIDRIQPESFVSNQLDDYGQYVKGWWNATWGRKDSVIVTTPGMSLVPGADGESYWYTDMQSSGNDDGSVGYILTNTRTKQARYYKLERGGSNITAAKSAIESAKGVVEAGYPATDPILYNVGGVETYFSVLIGKNGLPAMYGFVDLETGNITGVGKNIRQALREYQKALSRSSGLGSVADLMDLEKVIVTITGVSQINGNYYIMIEGNSSQEFWGESVEHVEMKWTKAGDKVEISYQKSEDPTRKQKSVMLQGFDNLQIDITSQK